MPTKTKLEWALDAAARGLRVFPQVGKRPSIRRWPDNATASEEAIHRWWTRWHDADIGIALATHLYVLDADTLPAMHALYELGLPLTLTVATARGEHRYFRVPHELARMTGSGGDGLAALEGKGSPGPVTWAGSIHPSGFEYRIAVDAPIAHMPGELVRAIGPKRPTANAGEATPAEREQWATRHRVVSMQHVGASEWVRDDAVADLRLTTRALQSELPDMLTGWASRFFRAGAYLGPHVASGGLGLDEAAKELTDLFHSLNTQGGDPSHVLRSIERGLATGARSVAL